MSALLVGVLGARGLAGGGTKHPLAGDRDHLSRFRVVNRHTCCLGTTSQTLAGKPRAPACRNKQVLSRLGCIMKAGHRGAREIGDSFLREFLYHRWTRTGEESRRRGAQECLTGAEVGKRRARECALVSFARQAEHLLAERFGDPEAGLALEVVQNGPHGG